MIAKKVTQIEERNITSRNLDIIGFIAHECGHKELVQAEIHAL